VREIKSIDLKAKLVGTLIMAGDLEVNGEKFTGIAMGIDRESFRLGGALPLYKICVLLPFDEYVEMINSAAVPERSFVVQRAEYPDWLWRFADGDLPGWTSDLSFAMRVKASELVDVLVRLKDHNPVASLVPISDEECPHGCVMAELDSDDGIHRKSCDLCVPYNEGGQG